LVVLWARILIRWAVQVLRAASTVLWECMSTWSAAMRPPTASHAMLVGMELVAARQVSAQVTAEQVAIPHHRVQLDRLRRTASHVTQVGTVRLRVPHECALAIALLGDTRLARLLLALHHRTALRVMLVGMELVGARRVSAQGSVWLANTHLARPQLDHRHRTALRVMLVGMELVAARRVSARVTVRAGDTLSHRMQLGHHPWTVLRVQ
jgi:hypothetical protein